NTIQPTSIVHGPIAFAVLEDRARFGASSRAGRQQHYCALAVSRRLSSIHGRALNACLATCWAAFVCCVPPTATSFSSREAPRNGELPTPWPKPISSPPTPALRQTSCAHLHR